MEGLLWGQCESRIPGESEFGDLYMRDINLCSATGFLSLIKHHHYIASKLHSTCQT